MRVKIDVFVPSVDVVVGMLLENDVGSNQKPEMLFG
jgi:hypothetical protein